MVPTQQDPFDAVAEDAAMYALGLLEGKERKRFEARLNAGCPLCAAETQSCTAVLGDVAAVGMSAVKPSDGLRGRLMSMAGGQFETGRDMHVVRGGPEGWVAGTVPGTMFKALDGARTYLIKMEPGATLPHHDHDFGAEQCLVLDGSAMAAGVEIHAGDYVRMPRGSHHEDFHSKDGCTLLISYV